MNKKVESQTIKKNKEQVLLELFESSEKIIFTPEYVRLDNEKINYNEITGVSFHSVKESINLLPTSQKYYFSIFSIDDGFDIDFSSIFYIDNDKKKEAWFKLIEIYDDYIKPLLLNKFIQEIFVENKSITIGNISFDSRGYHKQKIFGGINSALWSDAVYIPKIENGEIILFKQGKDKGIYFGQVSMEKQNAVIIPDLIVACTEIYRRNR